jgi:hypothetical protein
MRSLLRPVLAAVACLVILAALNHFHSVVLCISGRDEANRSNEPIDESFEAVRHARLEGQMALMRQITEIEASILRDFLAGSVSLLEAGEQFSELGQVNGEAALRSLRRVYPGASNRELYCRQVIFRALTLEHLNPIDEAKLCSRLKDQFKRHFANPTLASGGKPCPLMD